jgi:hypothetical protein
LLEVLESPIDLGSFLAVNAHVLASRLAVNHMASGGTAPDASGEVPTEGGP